MTEEEKKSALDAIVDLMPLELHQPGYQFLGPGTKLAKWLKQGGEGINRIDAAGKEYDKTW